MKARSLDDLPVITDIHKFNGNTRMPIAELAIISYKLDETHSKCELVGVLGTNGKTRDGQPPSVIYVGEPYKDAEGLHAHKVETATIEVNRIDSYQILETKEQRILPKKD